METDLNNANNELDLESRINKLERENRKLKRENTHLQNAVSQEKIAYTTILNQQKASTFIQRERERYLALLLANSPSIILFSSQAGRIEFCTDYFVAKTGNKSATDILGHTLTEVLSPFLDEESHNKLLKQNDNVIKTNMPINFDVTFRFNKDGRAEDFDGVIVPMNDEKQSSSGTMLLFHDVTDLKKSREEALAASRAKSHFLSNMSHEIRTPMNAIIGMTAIGKKETDLARKDYAFEKIETASVHLLGVINDVLDISKIESGKMELSHQAFSFPQMFDRVMSVIAQKIEEKNQRFDVEIDPNIPDTLHGDDQRLAQVITNIISNAAKFTPDEGNITFLAKMLSLHNDECVIQMYVKDTGIGISKKEQKKLFNIFQQAEAGTSRKFGGSGLGLAISKRILELMGGSIWVESDTGKGSCFYFTVTLNTLKDTEVKDAQVQELECEKESEYADFSGKTLLLVDDIDINLEIVMTLLEPTNIKIDTAMSGKNAVDLFIANSGTYDLILMDLQMPEIDGLQATRMIRDLNISNAATIPIIAMTANVFKEDIERCMQAGMNGHLGKPIVIEEVIKTLTHWFNSKK